MLVASFLFNYRKYCEFALCGKSFQGLLTAVVKEISIQGWFSSFISFDAALILHTRVGSVKLVRDVTIWPQNAITKNHIYEPSETLQCKL